MTSTDRNYDDLVPAQEKLEWVTPTILNMDAMDTNGKPIVNHNTENNCGVVSPCAGPS